MTHTSPDLIAIDHDDYHATHVGRIPDGRQFFVTTPFVPRIGNDPGREFVAVFLFDPDGAVVEARIDDLGPREALNEAYTQQVFDKRVRELGAVDYGRIMVRPFQIQRFGTTFGLIAHAPQAEDEEWWVTLEPGNSMAFHEPWDSGDYDT